MGPSYTFHLKKVNLMQRFIENLPKAEVLILDGDQSEGNEESAPDPKLLHNALKLSKINHFI